MPRKSSTPPAWVAFSLLLAAGCAAGRVETRPDPVVESGRTRTAAAPPFTLATGWTASVTVERRDSVLLTLPSGDSQLQRYGRHARFLVTVADDGSTTVRLDSLVFRPSAGSAGTDAVGTTWTGSLAPGGFDHVNPSRRSRVTDELGSMVRELFPVVPRSGVRVGDQWIDSVTATRQVEIFQSEDHRVGEWSVGEAIVRRGIGVMPIRVHEQYEQLGHGEQTGREMTMTAQGTRKSTYYIDREGMLIEAVHSDSATRLITIPSSRQIIPTIQFISTEIRFRPTERR